MKPAQRGITGAFIVLAITAGAWYWTHRTAPVAPPPPPVPQAVRVEPAPSAPTPAPGPVIRHPVPAASQAAAGASGIEGALARLFGRDATLFIAQDFVPHVVATVDALGRAHASPLVWPVQGPPGRFETRAGADGVVIARDNGLRYARYLHALRHVDLQRLAAAYIELYPQFQSAYRDLGYPQGYFNDRFVEVLDLLISTPVVERPIRLERPQAASGQAPTPTPTLYVYADPALESLSAGQKILLRMGPERERAVQARLRAWRRLITTGGKP
ncbi:MAG: DUF3014 domain-containing protein [Burkholderiales bacterium]|nr:DUF3014 domain-containing protein [Burkholderiales bacterium]MDE2157700.1 DUF3014 domain-containing protein [Burkholderiales bacterium]MDE2503553.1 DUF3014 domain-containing protein [Burkholderiales bacterium]